MGDAGSLFLGFLLAILTVRLKPETQESVGSYAIPILLLAAPILDTSVAVVSRIANHKSPFTGGTDHLSHRLIAQGLSRKITIFVLQLITLIFAILAILIAISNLNEIALVTFASILFLALSFYFAKSSILK